METMDMFDDYSFSPSWIDDSLNNLYRGLIIDFCKEQPYLFFVDIEFSELYQPSWLENELNIRILREIDNAILCPSGLCTIDDPTNIFSVFDISTGAKALILCNMFNNVVVWGPFFGDNCTDILLEICKNKTVKIIQGHLLRFSVDKFKAYSICKGREYQNYKEYKYECVLEIV